MGLCFRWLVIYFLYYENRFPDASLNKFIKRSDNSFERCCRIQVLFQEQHILFKSIKTEFARERSSRYLTTMGYYTGVDPAFVIKGDLIQKFSCQILQNYSKQASFL